MNVSWRWLKALLPAGALDGTTPDKVAEGLTMQGLPVDEVRAAFAEFTGVVVGRVLDARPHPEADRLTLCAVAAGDGERQVVCGAPNVEVGALYGYATVGARLPGEREIRRAEIRGVASEGMLCSAPELGLDALGSADGIWPLPDVADADLGRDLREVLGLDDVVLVVDVPSNRGDALSHLGIAREVAWLLDATLDRPPIGDLESSVSASGAVVVVEDPDGCPGYLARALGGVTVGPSPGWLQIRLTGVGQRPVNNVVDVTNFVMLECGQPLHPFDLDRIGGGRIVVRRPREGERLTTLDGRERRPDAEMTLIADGERAVAIGGVMGGEDSEVTASTGRVLLEAAVFEAVRVGRTARRLGLVTEASIRFARGVDAAATSWALDRATALVAEVSGARVEGGVAGHPPPVPSRPPIGLREARVAAIVGRPIAREEAARGLARLGFEATDGAQVGWRAPSWRHDVEREIDLIEEVARLTGYDEVPLTPLPAPSVAPARRPLERREARLRSVLAGLGFDEAKTPSFVDRRVLGAGSPVDKMVEIKNPISKEDRYMRPYVVATLGGAVAHNLRRGAGRVRLFEIGHAFVRDPDAGIRERRAVALAGAGPMEPLHWSVGEGGGYGFFDIKGDLERALAGGGGPGCRFEAGERPYLHPGRQADVVSAEGRRIGFLGEVEPGLVARWGVDGRVVVAECELAPLVGDPGSLRLGPIPREPSIERDLALVVPDGDRCADVLTAIREVDLADLDEVRVFDLYRGPQVEAGHHSLGIRLTFQADRTLTLDEIDARIERLLGRLAERRGYRIR